MAVSVVQAQGAVGHRFACAPVARVGVVTETSRPRLKLGTPTARHPYQFLRGAVAPTVMRWLATWLA
jgi:hypothetical protein